MEKKKNEAIKYLTLNCSQSTSITSRRGGWNYYVQSSQCIWDKTAYP